jgi:hypothetical protein
VIWSTGQHLYTKLLPAEASPAPRYFLRLILKYLSHRPVLHTLTLCSPLNVWNQVSRPYNTMRRSVHVTPYVFTQETGREILDQTVSSFTRM